MDECGGEGRGRKEGKKRDGRMWRGRVRKIGREKARWKDVAGKGEEGRNRDGRT